MIEDPQCQESRPAPVLPNLLERQQSNHHIGSFYSANGYRTQAELIFHQHTAHQDDMKCVMTLLGNQWVINITLTGPASHLGDALGNGQPQMKLADQKHTYSPT